MRSVLGLLTYNFHNAARAALNPGRLEMYVWHKNKYAPRFYCCAKNWLAHDFCVNWNGHQVCHSCTWTELVISFCLLSNNFIIRLAVVFWKGNRYLLKKNTFYSLIFRIRMLVLGKNFTLKLQRPLAVSDFSWMIPFWLIFKIFLETRFSIQIWTPSSNWQRICWCLLTLDSFSKVIGQLFGWLLIQIDLLSFLEWLLI